MQAPLPRLISIDTMRGFAIVLMALDHTRDYFSNAMFSPTDLNHTNAAYFFTRWLTHLCAPTFVFLAGTSANLTAVRHNLSRSRLSGYLIRRGLLLVILELTVIRFGWTFNLDYRYAIAQVIWALGWSMVGLALLIRLPRNFIVIISTAAIAGHNLLDGIKPEQLGDLSWLWVIVHVPGVMRLSADVAIYSFYPLMPWFAVMSLGYWLGPLFLELQENRRFKMAVTGLTLIAAFILLRMLNIYGDPQPWQSQNSALFTLLSFLKVQKYPPSLLYLLVTLGLMFLFLTLFERAGPSRYSKILIVFGRTPLFFYMAHIYLIHAAALVIAWLRGLPVNWLLEGSVNIPFPVVPLPNYGFNLAAVYGLWLVLLVILYPFCLKLADKAYVRK